MVKVETIRDDNEKRILKCQEDNRIWYQIWITQLDMNCIERYFDALVCLGFTWFKLLGVALMILLWPIVFIYAALNDGIEGYPFKKYAIPYIFILVAWFIIFLYGLVS